MVRLGLYSLIPFSLLAAADGGIAAFAGKLSSDAPQERLGFLVNVGGKLVIILVALFVRLCFDLAQAQVVRDDERAVLRVLWQSVKLAFQSGKLFAAYLGIGLLAAISFGVGVGVWAYLPHSAMGTAFVVLELVTVTQIASRLWLKAASAHQIALLPMRDSASETAAAVIEFGRPVVE